MATRLRAAELEVLFTANTDDVTRAEKVIKTAKDKVEKDPIKPKVEADTKTAVDRMKDVEQAQKRIVSAKTITTVDANIARAEKNFTRLYERVDYLKSVSPELNVDADITRATKQMERAQKQLEGLRGARAVMEVDADTQPLEDATDGLGEAAGDKVGKGLDKNLIAALTAIPIAGGVLLAGKAIGQAVIDGVQQGMQIEVRQDRLEALTGINEAQARRIALSAGEAYAQNFGDSIESNMNTARLGLQFGIIDAGATTRDAQTTIQGLAGIADVLEEDVKPTAAAVATLLKTGLASSAEDAYDIIAAGARNGLNRNDDLLDTLTEYPVVLRKLGLSGSDSLGLINQGLKAGARNTDVLADALKEFQIRATDGSDSSRSGFERLGLDATDMTARIARGGSDARAGLDEVLRKLREMQDPVQRNAAAVELFGTKAEDLGDALFALDPSTAVETLGQVQGAAQRMFDTLNNNDASKMEQAKRNIDVALEGIQGALAVGLADPLATAAEWVSQNRGPVMKFFLDVANGAIMFGETMVNSAADGSIAFSEFVAGPGADMIDLLIGIQKSLNPFADTSELESLRDGMRLVDDTTRVTAETLRTDLLDGLEQARAKINEFGEPAVAMGFLSDAAQRTASAVANLGDEHSTLTQQITDAASALQAELTAADAAGESQDELRARFESTTGALSEQLQQMGMTKEEADRLVQSYLSFPQMVSTAVVANTEPAQNSVNQLISQFNGTTIRLNVATDSLDATSIRPVVQNARGNILTPMSGKTATVVPPNTWRVVGDRPDVSELFAPLDGSARSWALIQEGIRRMPGVMPMADGGVVGQAAGGSSFGVSVGDISPRIDLSPSVAELRQLIEAVVREWSQRNFGRGGLG